MNDSCDHYFRVRAVLPGGRYRFLTLTGSGEDAVRAQLALDLPPGSQVLDVQELGIAA